MEDEKTIDERVLKEMEKTDENICPRCGFPKRKYITGNSKDGLTEEIECEC